MERESMSIVCRVGAGAVALGVVAFGASALVSAAEPTPRSEGGGDQRAPGYGQAAAAMLRDNPELAARLRIELTQGGAVELPQQTVTFSTQSAPQPTAPKRAEEGSGTFDIHWSEESHEHKARITVRRAGE